MDSRSALNLNSDSTTTGVDDDRRLRRPIDLVHLATYTLGDRSLESELLGLFRTQAGLYLNRLEMAATDKDWKDAAHSLKGSARALGALFLGDLAARAETGSIIGDDLFRCRMIADIATEVDIVTRYIDGLTAA